VALPRYNFVCNYCLTYVCCEHAVARLISSQIKSRYSRLTLVFTENVS
jgi:hypothetical protein